MASIILLIFSVTANMEEARMSDDKTLTELNRVTAEKANSRRKGVRLAPQAGLAPCGVSRRRTPQ